jgi:hypothetical protein
MFSIVLPRGSQLRSIPANVLETQRFARGQVVKTIESIVAIGVLAAAFGACDGQATPDYQGVPLAQLQGTISTGPTTVMPPDLVAGLSWVKPIASEGSATANTCGGALVVAIPGPVPVEVPVKGSFPARFALDIFSPPPAEMIGNDRLARAAVVVFEKATSRVWGTTTPGSQLVYVAPGFTGSLDTTVADRCTGWTDADHWEKNSHVPGYYLLQLTKDCLLPTGAPGPGVDTKQLQEAPQGLATDLTIEVEAPPTEPALTGPCPVTMTGP